MSQYPIVREDKEIAMRVGFDPGMRSFFAQLYTFSDWKISEADFISLSPEDQDKEIEPFLWIGSGAFEEITSIEQLKERLGRYAPLLDEETERKIVADQTAIRGGELSLIQEMALGAGLIPDARRPAKNPITKERLMEAFVNDKLPRMAGISPDDIRFRAAEAAGEMIASHWTDALADGHRTEQQLFDDVDLIVEILQEWKKDYLSKLMPATERD